VTVLAALWHGGWLRAVDHALALSLGHARADTPDAVQVAAALASRALALGHARVALDRLDGLFAAIDPERAPPALPDPDEWRIALAASPWVHAVAADGGREPSPPGHVLVLEGDALALRRYRELEVRVATALRRRAQATLDSVPRLQLVTGGPGTGKTTRVAQLLAQDTAPTTRVALAAPTGKAAARLAEALREARAPAHAAPVTAATLHRLLGWQRDGGWRHGPAHPLPFEVVVVDEASMVDLPLMAALLEALADDALLVLAGDPDQLPSVEAGDVLTAVCAASEAPGSPLAARRTHLRHAHRPVPGFDVATLAAHVRDGDAGAVLAGLAARRFAGVHWHPGGDRALAAAVAGEALAAYRAVATAPDLEAALQAARAFRILCALREGPAGSATLNAQLGQALDPLHGGHGWFRGRLLLVTENSPRQQLFNGDVGLVWPDAQGEPRVWFEADAGPRAWLPAALPAHEPAYALTVHKAQGSEFDRAWLVLPERGARVLSRELLYTGLTRARRELHLWAAEAPLRSAIGRRAQRWSGLAARLQGDD